MYLWWSLCTLCLLGEIVTVGDSGLEDVLLVEFTYRVSTRMPGESYSW